MGTRRGPVDVVQNAMLLVLMGVLAEYMDFCNQKYAKILKHGSTRWLSLARCIQRTLEKYAGLKSYFLSEHFPDSRFERLLLVSGLGFGLGQSCFA